MGNHGRDRMAVGITQSLS